MRELRELACEEMIRALHDPYGDLAGPFPCSRQLGERGRAPVLVALSLHDGERPGHPIQEIEYAVVGGEPDRDEALHLRIPQRPLKPHPRPEGETRAPQRTPPRPLSRVRGRGGDVRFLLIPPGIGALALADSTKVESQRRVPRLVEDTIDRVHDLAVHRAAVRRVGMGDDGRGKAAAWIGPESFHPPDGTLEFDGGHVTGGGNGRFHVSIPLRVEGNSRVFENECLRYNLHAQAPNPAFEEVFAWHSGSRKRRSTV